MSLNYVSIVVNNFLMEQVKSVELRKQSEVVQTLRPDGRPGESIPKHEYDNWSFFILSTLAKESDITLNGLLERASQRSNLSKAAESKISWYILQVKRDLEARSLIAVVPAASKHTFLIQLTRQGLSRISDSFQLSEWAKDSL